MSSYKLTYFNGQGRAEVARMLLTLAGKKFEDVRVTREQWQEMKQSTPFGALPMLEVGDVVLCQSQAICYYIANETGKAGKDDLEKARAIMIVNCIDDTFTPFYKTFSEQDKTKKTEQRKNYCSETLPPFLKKFETFLEKSGTKFFIGNEITWPDLAVYQMVAGLKLFDDMEDNFPEMEKTYPKLNEVIKQVHEKLSVYIDERAKTSF